LILPEMPEPSEDSELNAKRQREFFHLLIKPQLNAKLLLKEKTSTPQSLELNSKNSAWISSENVCHPLKMS
jgi:hypothetical protein